MEGSACIRATARRANPLLLGLIGLFSPTQAEAKEGGWQIEPFGRVELGVVSARARIDDYDFIYIGDATYLRGQAGIELADSNTSLELDFDRIIVARFDKDRPNTDRDRFTATFAQEIDEGWELQLQLRHYDDLVSAEYNDTDDVEFAAQLEYQPVRAHRFRFEVTWRDREYDDENGPDGASTHGEGPKVTAAYRYRLGRYHYISLDLRAEEIDSDNPRREFARQSVGVSYTHPITHDLRVRPALAIRHTSFPGRFTPTDRSRSDTYITPEVEMLWWKGSWRVEAEAKYVISGSNDPRRDRKGHRLNLSIGYVF